MKIHTGDTVQVIAGKDAKKQGVVERVYTKAQKIRVKDINMYKKHVKRTESQQGGVVSIERPLGVSKVMLVCPHCKKATRVGYSVKQDKKVRVCKKCKKAI